MPCEHTQLDSTTEKNKIEPLTKKKPEIDIQFQTKKKMVHKTVHFTETQDSMHPIVCGY